MGSTTTSTSTTPQPTATDLALQQNELNISNATNQGSINNALQAQGLQSSLMGGTALPGYLSSLPGGVSQGQSMNEAQLGLQGLSTTAQSMGGLDTGSYQQAGANAFANTLNSNATFNVQNLAQLLSLASGNAYQNVGNAANNNSQLGTLATSLTGTTGTSTTSANPFAEILGLGSSALSAAGSASTSGNIWSGFGF